MRAVVRRSRLADGGFTLIELVVVITVIGILAAIIVPSFRGIQDGVRQAATGSDLRSDRTALAEYAIDNNGKFPAASGFTPTTGATNLTGYGWSQSPDTIGYHYVTNSSGTAWCLDMTNATGVTYYITTNGPTSPSGTGTGPCSSVPSSAY